MFVYLWAARHVIFFQYKRANWCFSEHALLKCNTVWKVQYASYRGIHHTVVSVQLCECVYVYGMRVWMQETYWLLYVSSTVTIAYTMSPHVTQLLWHSLCLFMTDIIQIIMTNILFLLLGFRSFLFSIQVLTYCFLGWVCVRFFCG